MLQKKMEDYLVEMYKLFPDVEAESIKGIIEGGLKKLHFILKKGNDVLMKDFDSSVYIGESGNYNQMSRSYKKEHIKYRRMFIDEKQPWDGHHYFGLTEEKNEIFKTLPLKVSLYKIMKESAIGPNLKYIYRLKLNYKVDVNKIPWREDKEVTIDQVELSEEGMKRLKNKIQTNKENEEN